MRSESHRAIRLSEREARTVLLIQAVDDTDAEGVLLPPRARAAAAGRVFDDVRKTDDGARLRARASLLRDDLLRETPALGAVLDPPRPRGVVLFATVAVAAALGAATNLLGPERHLSVLAFPLAGIVVWNLVVYAGLAARLIARSVRRAPRRDLTVAVRWLEGVPLSRLARRLGASTRSAAVAHAVERFRGRWLETAAPLLAARVRLVLHLAALAMALGAVGGMYLSGIALEYRATWESTWLDAPAVQRYLDLVLGPAARVLGISVPDVEAIRSPGGEGSAAPWIHLWATTLGLFVLLPRAALVLVEAVTAARLSRWLSVRLDPGYVRRALQAGRGAATVVEIVYYSCAPDGALRERLHALLQEHAGARALVRDSAWLEYGDGADRIALPEGASGLLVLVFALAQTPEPEVHGELLQGAQDLADGAGWQTMVVLETATYRQRIGSESRVRERRATWDRLLRDLTPTVVELA